MSDVSVSKVKKNNKKVKIGNRAQLIKLFAAVI